VIVEELNFKMSDCEANVVRFFSTGKVHQATIVGMRTLLSLNVAEDATYFRNVSLLGDDTAKADLICSAFRRMVFMSWFFAARPCGVEILSLDYQFSKFTQYFSIRFFSEDFNSALKAVF
jgi:hypothetical protein